MKLRFLLPVLLLILLVSCSKADFSVSSVQAQPYVGMDGRMGLSLYVITSEGDESTVQFSLKAPDGNLSWSFGALKVELDGMTYLGSSDICMPMGSLLPEGTWSLDVLYKDGSTVTKTFEVDYGDVEAAKENFLAEGTGSAWYDMAENLTVLPLPETEEESSDDSSDLSV